MTAPNLLDELEGVVRLMVAASFSDLDWGWRRDDDDTPGSIFTHSFGGAHQAVAMCPRYGKDNFAADASYLTALHNFLRTHHAEIAEAVADARRYRWLRDDAVHYGSDDGQPTPWVVFGTCAEDALPHWEQDLGAAIDAAIDAQHNSAREGSDGH